MSQPENYKKFEFDSGNEEQPYFRQRILPEGRFFPKAEFSEVSEMWIQHTT